MGSKPRTEARQAGLPKKELATAPGEAASSSSSAQTSASTTASEKGLIFTAATCAVFCEATICRPSSRSRRNQPKCS